MEAWRELGFPYDPPTRVAATRIELIRLLVLAGEEVRAQQHIGGKFDHNPTAAAILRLTRKQVAVVVEERQRYSIVSRKAARIHLARVQRLYHAALEDGETAVPLELLARALNGAPEFTSTDGYAL